MSPTLSAAQVIQIYETRLDEQLNEIAELRRFKAAALCMIECLSEKRPDGAVRAL